MPKGRILGFQGQRAALHFPGLATRFSLYWWPLEILDTLGADVLPFALPGVVGKGALAQWEWGSDPSAAASSQLRGLELALSGSLCVLPLRGQHASRELGVPAPAGAPCPAPPGPSRGCCLLGLGPQQQPLLPSPPAFFWPAQRRSPPSMWVSTQQSATLLLGGAEVLLTRVPHVGTAFCA